MEISPLSDRSVAEEEEQDFLTQSSRRKKRTLADRRAALRPLVIGIGLTVLVAVAAVGAYRLAAGIDWWNEHPSAAATPTVHPVPMPSVSSEAAMSGGYQIGPDGVLVRPAEHAASTYTKPELPEEAKENTERGAELAAEHAFSLLIYAWNTGDTQPFADITQVGDGFRETYIGKVKKSYASGWTYGMHSSITRIVKVEPVSEQKWGAQPNTIGVQFKTITSNWVTCVKQKISTDESEYGSSVTLFMTWKNEHWVVTDGDISNDK